MDKELLPEFKDKDRVANTANPNIMPYDMSLKRKVILAREIKRLEKGIYPN